jgi:hypothetical protein
MPSESPHETPAQRDPVGSAAKDEDVRQTETADSDSQLPAELSQFSQRLASFGLGEAPDPLLTEARPPGKRRSQR